MSGLTYRGQELRVGTGPIGAPLWAHIPGGPYGRLQVRGVDPAIPAKRGRWAGNRKADIRVVPVHVWVLGDDPADYDELRTLLDTIFDPELDAGLLRLGTDYPGIVVPRAITVRFENYMATEDVDHHAAELDVELVTVEDPDWHEVAGS